MTLNQSTRGGGRDVTVGKKTERDSNYENPLAITWTNAADSKGATAATDQEAPSDWPKLSSTAALLQKAICCLATGIQTLTGWPTGRRRCIEWQILASDSDLDEGEDKAQVTPRNQQGGRPHQGQSHSRGQPGTGCSGGPHTEQSRPRQSRSFS